jgi:molecular chaperone DnaK
MGIKVGIDLGTTFCAVAYIDPASGQAVIIPNKLGNPITPSVIAITEDGEVLHGTPAKDLFETGEPNTASFFKRLMGDPDFMLVLHDKIYNATDLSALLLRGLIDEAQEWLGQKIDSAVITCPAYFRNREREATIQAGKQAGIQVIELLNEPSAAALAHGLKDRVSDCTILIYDLGGGTFDVTIAKVTPQDITVLGSDGNHSLGGKNWDDAIARWIINQFYDEHSIDINESIEQIGVVMGLAETAKKRLSSSDTANIVVHYQGKRGNYSLSVAEFNDITCSWLGETQTIIKRLFASIASTTATDFSWSDIHGVILVGGSTRMRMVHDFVKNMTGKEPLSGVNVDEAVALGAAIRANQQTMSLGAADTTTDTPQMFLGGKGLKDTIAHALGLIVASADGERYVNQVMLRKNSQIPTQMTERLEKAVQKSGDNPFEVYILQGDDPFPLNNDITGKYIFSGIEFVPGGKAEIMVTYRYNENGIIEVDAMQTGNAKPLSKTKAIDLGDLSWLERSPKDVVAEQHKLQGKETEYYFVADLSGSMSGAPLTAVKEAMKSFVEVQIDLTKHKVGIMGVADSIKIYTAPTQDKAKVISAINSMKIKDCGYGNDAHPFDELLKTFSKNAQAKCAVVFADGVWSHQARAIKVAKRCHEAGIDVIGLGFGGADEKFMKAISNRKDLSGVTDQSDLTQSLSSILQQYGDPVVGLRK